VLWVLAYQVALGLAPAGHWVRIEALAGVWLLACIATRISPLPLLGRALFVAPFALAALPDPDRMFMVFIRAWLGLAATLWLLAWLGTDELLRSTSK